MRRSTIQVLAVLLVAGVALRRFRVPLDAPVVIVADRMAPYRHVIPVLESVREAGYWRISFSAR